MGHGFTTRDAVVAQERVRCLNGKSMGGGSNIRGHAHTRQVLVKKLFVQVGLKGRAVRVGLV